MIFTSTSCDVFITAQAKLGPTCQWKGKSLKNAWTVLVVATQVMYSSIIIV